MNRLHVFAWIFVAVMTVLIGPRASGDSPVDRPVSEYAPQADILAQVDFFLGRVKESLADPADFDLAKQARTLKDAHTLAVLALVLSQHDADFPEKASMPALLKAAQALAAAEADATKATAALAELEAARAGKAAGGEEGAWRPVGELPLLMKQVPLIHAGLKRGATASRLKRSAEQSAGQAAALAAIAQASIFDEQYASSPDEVAAWRQYCIEMRDAAGEVNAAVHALDAARVEAGMKQILVSCEACHAKFRQP